MELLEPFYTQLTREENQFLLMALATTDDICDLPSSGADLAEICEVLTCLGLVRSTYEVDLAEISELLPS